MRMSLDAFAPQLEDNAYSYVEIGAADRDALVEVLLDSAVAIAQQPTTQPAGQQAAAMRQIGRGGGGASRGRTLYRGVNDLSTFEGDVDLLVAAAQLIGFGRVDIADDDGYWVVDDGLTVAGRRALAIMEQENIVVHLADPSQALMREMLSAATRPFVVTGDYSIGAEMVEAVNEKGILVGITFNPADVRGCISEILATRALLGDTDNIFLTLTTDEGLEEAQKALYMGLIAEGWTNTEIVGDRREGGGVTGANLRRLSGGGGMARR
jgi:hypothetical protein